MAKSEEIQDLLTKMIGLALLPEHKISIAFEKIKINLPEQIRRRYKYYLQYFERFWLNRVKPSRFSVYRKLKRTNNLIERYHKTLNHKFGNNRDPWIFINEFHIYFLTEKII